MPGTHREIDWNEFFLYMLNFQNSMVKPKKHPVFSTVTGYVPYTGIKFHYIRIFFFYQNFFCRLLPNYTCTYVITAVPQNFKGNVCISFTSLMTNSPGLQGFATIFLSVFLQMCKVSYYTVCQTLTGTRPLHRPTTLSWATTDDTTATIPNGLVRLAKKQMEDTYN